MTSPNKDDIVETVGSIFEKISETDQLIQICQDHYANAKTKLGIFNAATEDQSELQESLKTELYELLTPMFQPYLHGNIQDLDIADLKDHVLFVLQSLNEGLQAIKKKADEMKETCLVLMKDFDVKKGKD